jgi:hypothetical protein
MKAECFQKLNKEKRAAVQHLDRDSVSEADL